LRVFYSYSHVDEPMLHELRKHLAVLRRQGLITEWYDRDIEAGAAWRQEIARQIEAADIILLLVSADFLSSDFCYEEEMLRAVERSYRGEATTIGVILRPVDGWQSTPFASLQVVPRDGRPITRWPNADDAYSDVAARIRSLLGTRVLPGHSGEPSGRIQVTRSADPRANPDASARSREIAIVLRELLRQPKESGPYVIVSEESRRHYFTQCLADPQDGTFWCEAVSNEFLDPGKELGAAQMSRLSALGWDPPGADVDNWSCVLDTAEDVASLMVRTLSEVYGARLNEPLHIEKPW
jgi:hypothetical protein